MYDVWEREQKKCNVVIGFLATIAIARIAFICFIAFQLLQSIHDLANYDVVPGHVWHKVFYYGFWLMILAIAQIRVDLKK